MSNNKKNPQDGAQVPKKEAPQLDAEHQRLLKEAERMPGVRDAMEVFRKWQESEEVSNLSYELLSEDASETTTGSDTSRPLMPA